MLEMVAEEVQVVISQNLLIKTAITGTKRCTPDVAVCADPNYGLPVYDSFAYQGSSGWLEVRGTSASCAVFAGIVALMQQLRKSLSKPLLSTNQLQTYLYNMYSSNKPLYANDFFDIVSGSAGTHTAGTGYDFVTGLGSCNCANKATVSPILPVLTGIGAAASNLGSMGNSYLDLSTGNAYFYGASGWSLTSNIVPTSSSASTGFITSCANNS